MSYYKELKQAYIFLEKKIHDNPNIDNDKLIYVTTLKYAVSEKKIIERIKIIKKIINEV